MESKPMRVAVIGSGVSGLAAMKSCLDEGLQPTCFERSDSLGGLWRYRENPEEGQGCVMKSTVINTSKEMMSFSDFPVPEKYPNFMHNTQLIEFFEMYSRHFGLDEYIQYNTDVISVRKSDNFDEDGKWKVSTRNKKTGEETTQVFDACLVCTGHHGDKYLPKFQGLERFKGKVLHSHDYRKPAGFEDKRVLVIGIGNSGGDVATELSRIASQVYLSTRRGTWILHRVSDNGLPMDMLNNRRVMFKIKESFKTGFNALMRRKINSRIDHEMYRIRPIYEPHQQQPMVNDDMPNRIICGAIQVKADIKQFTETGVEFTDGTSEDNIDAVILATGYSFGFPFLDSEVMEVKENIINLYMNTFLPDLAKPTMAIIGCVQGFGAITPEVEMQCRTATRVFKGDSQLPSRDEMWKNILYKHSDNARRYAKSRRHTIMVESQEFMDGLADLCGCSIDFWKLATTDPLLAWQVYFGPFTPYQFRLFGVGKWEGARDAIMKQWNRVYQPFKTRPLEEKPRRSLIELPAMALGWIILLSIAFIWVFC